METTQKKSSLFLKASDPPVGNRNLFYHRRAYFSLCVGKSLQLYEQRPEQPSVAGVTSSVPSIKVDSLFL